MGQCVPHTVVLRSGFSHTAKPQCCKAEHTRSASLCMPVVLSSHLDCLRWPPIASCMPFLTCCATCNACKDLNLPFLRE